MKKKRNSWWAWWVLDVATQTVSEYRQPVVLTELGDGTWGEAVEDGDWLAGDPIPVTDWLRYEGCESLQDAIEDYEKHNIPSSPDYLGGGYLSIVIRAQELESDEPNDYEEWYEDEAGNRYEVEYVEDW